MNTTKIKQPRILLFPSILQNKRKASSKTQSILILKTLNLKQMGMGGRDIKDGCKNLMTNNLKNVPLNIFNLLCI